MNEPADLKHLHDRYEDVNRRVRLIEVRLGIVKPSPGEGKKDDV